MATSDLGQQWKAALDPYNSQEGSGASTVSKHLAKARDCILLDADTVLAEALRSVSAEEEAEAKARREEQKAAGGGGDGEGEDGEDEGDEEDEEDEGEGEDEGEAADAGPQLPPLPPTAAAREATALLRSGQPVPMYLLTDLLGERVAAPEVAHRGYVLCGFPSNVAPTYECEKQLEALLGWPVQPDYVVNVKISDADLRRRRLGMKVDPITNTQYSPQVVAAAMAQLDPEAAAAAAGGEDEGEDEPEEEEEEEGEEGEGGGEADPFAARRRQLYQMQPVPLPSAEVLARLIDDPHANSINTQLGNYHSGPSAVINNYVETFPSCKQLTADVMLPVHETVNSLMCQIDVVMHPTIYKPRLLEPLYQEFDTDEDALEALAQNGLDDEEQPPWRVSGYGMHCPVTLMEDDALVKGSAKYAVAFRDQVFVFETQGKRDRFYRNPVEYLRRRARPPCRVCVVGPSEAERTAVLADFMGSHYRASVLDPEALAQAMVAEQGDQQVDDGKEAERPPLPKDPSTDTIHVRLTQASPAPKTSAPPPAATDAQAYPPEVYAEAIARAITSSGSRNWILKGFPRNTAELNALVEKQVLPMHAFFVGSTQDKDALEKLKSEVENERMQSHVLLPETGGAGEEEEEEGADDDDNSKAGRGHVAFRFGNPVSADVAKVVDVLEAPLRSVAVVTAHEMPEAEEEEEEADGAGGDGVGLAGQELDQDLELGDTKSYCPVALLDNNVLRPGEADMAVKFNDAFYHCSTPEAQDAFAAAPHRYVDPDTPPKLPPPRILLTGPASSGKSLVGRRLARHYRMYHVSFRTRLREMGNTTDDADLAEAIAAYLAAPEENPLGSNIAVDAVRDYWTSEPFLTRGFVIEGFPRNAEDAKTLVDAGLYPDANIVLHISPEVSERRQLNKLLGAFQKKRDAILAERKVKADAKAKAAAERRAVWDAEQAAKRAAWEADRAADKAAQREELGEDYVSEDDEPYDEEDYYDEVGEAEAAEEEEEEELETDDEARDRLTEEIANALAEVEEGAESAAEFLGEDANVFVSTINADISEARVYATVEKRLRRFLSCRASLLTSAQALTMEAAQIMLKTGHRSLSSFASWCPVKLQRNEAVQPIRADQPCYPAALRKYVYFFSSAEARRAFIEHPLKFLAQRAPPPVVPVRLAIIGPPNSGKTTLANALCDKYGCFRVTFGRALRWVLATHADTDLGQRVEERLKSGGVVDDEMALDAVEMLLQSPVCRNFGYVLDGTPVTVAQAEGLVARHILPNNVIELEADEATLAARAAAGSTTEFGVLEMHCVQGIFRRRLDTFHREASAVRGFYSANHHSWSALDAHHSKWWLLEHASKKVEHTMRGEQEYIRCITEKRPAPVASLRLPAGEIKSRLSAMRCFCPVQLAKGVLMETNIEDLRNTVEFKGVFYKLSGDSEVAEFCAHPEKYMGQTLPTKLPQRINAAQVTAAFPKQLSFQGFCPVTYDRGNRRYESMLPGDAEFAVEYDGQLFAMVNEGMRELFMQRPVHFASIPLPKKVPPKVKPMPVGQLPMLGYMEQTAASIVTKALTAVGLAKPKYPYLTTQQSAELYVALYLKAHNPRKSDYERRIYRQKLRKFEEKCELVRYLGKVMGRTFRDKRPVDFDHKMREFESVKAKVVGSA